MHQRRIESERVQPASPRSEPEGGAGFYSAVWRWHFYAAFLVVPMIILQALSGIVYLFRPEIEPIGHLDKYYVTPSAERATYAAQLEAVAQRFPGRRAQAVRISPDPARSTQFLFAGAKTGPETAYVNP